MQYISDLECIDLEIEKLFGFLMQFTVNSLRISENNLLHFKNFKYDATNLLNEAIQKNYIICVGENGVGVNLYTITDKGRALRDFKR